MTAAKQLPAFEKFITDLRAAWAELPNTEARMKRGQELLSELLRDPGLRTASKSWPSTEGRKNLLFYEDPDFGFAINGVVRVPGRKGSIHDHAHAWTALEFSMEPSVWNVISASTMAPGRAMRNSISKALLKDIQGMSILSHRSRFMRSKAGHRAPSP